MKFLNKFPITFVGVSGSKTNSKESFGPENLNMTTLKLFIILKILIEVMTFLM